MSEESSSSIFWNTGECRQRYSTYLQIESLAQKQSIWIKRITDMREQSHLMYIGGLTIWCALRGWQCFMKAAAWTPTKSRGAWWMQLDMIERQVVALSIRYITAQCVAVSGLTEPWSPWQIRGVRVAGSTQIWGMAAFIMELSCTWSRYAQHSLHTFTHCSGILPTKRLSWNKDNKQKKMEIKLL